MARILLAGLFHADAVAFLGERKDIQVEQLDEPASEQDILDRIAEADAIVLRNTPFGAEACAKAERLKVIARHGVGYDNVDVEAATRHGIPLAVVGEANSTAVAEHAFMLMLATVKDALPFDRAVRGENYGRRNTLTAGEVSGKTILIVGFGRIGTRMARRCAAFDMQVIVADPYVPQRVVRGQGYEYVEDFRDALDRADVVSLHRPGNQDGSAEMAGQEFSRMREGSVLINTARGTLIDEDALHQALTNGPLAAAGLDVTRSEPPPADLPLLQLDNVFFSPHIAGVTREAFRAMGLRAMQNCLDAIDGRLDPYYVINPEAI
ncbi:MAG: hydroxyacid dehydrogenase [Alphaproteobacteria bacterium]|jgi:D-3-phosphoglycerate dehydrogenase|nr:hydroxyacid dehydrogenase [Alphaproteobacteria bacterium]MDP6565374.1 hydroxyacid dehydrogenase [Alphaproteobacteria bacterium]MDP6813522.1 hydroxyacid dehydrogenase [Alphaproteobacteria bacterium]